MPTRSAHSRKNRPATEAGSTEASSCSSRRFSTSLRATTSRGGAGAARETRATGRIVGVQTSRLLAPNGHAARQDVPGDALAIRQCAVEGLAMTFWRGRRVLVTGHTGFKGSWLTLWLRSLGAEVTGYALPPATNPNHYEIANVGDGIHSVFADIRDAQKMREAFDASKPEVVFHLAAQSLVRASYDMPRETYEVNVIGTANVLDAVRASDSVRAVVIVTSDKCYENREWSWGYRESDALGGHDPYSSSKAAAEIVTAAYRSSYFHGPNAARVASARAGNVIGGGDWARDRLIPDLVTAFARGEKALIRNPSAIRQ